MVAFYTRNVYGQVAEHNSIEEAIKNFVAYEGYRLSIATDELDLHIHRDELPLIPMSEQIQATYKTYEAKVSYAERIKNN